MPKFYLLGGENVLRRNAKEINQEAFADAGGDPKVLVFTWAKVSFDKTYQKQKRFLDYFTSLGAKAINIADYSAPLCEIQQKTAESNLIYLTGGVPSVLIERLRKQNTDSLLGNFDGVIVGRSAGALVLCRKFVITYRSNCKVKVIDGFGLVDFTLKAHYKAANDGDLLKLSKTEKIYAVPEGSAIVSENGKNSFINPVYLFENGVKRLLS
jgi:dipeptidase E